MRNFTITHSLIKRLSMLFAFMVISTVSAFSQANPIEYVEEDLDNGLHVIYSIDRSAPVVSTILHYKVGCKDEDPNLTGFAHFFEHLMFESTDEIPKGSMDKYIQEAGGILNAHTSFDETVYKFTVPSHQIKLALWIESSRMRKLQVGEVGVETQRGVVKEEKKNRNDNSPYGSWMEKMFYNVFKGGNYSWVPIGSIEHINRATIQDFQNFYNNFYQPNNGTLVIVGDFDLEETKKYVRSYFGRYKKGSEPVRSEFKLPPMDGPYRETIEDNKAQLPAAFMGLRGPKMGEKDYYALSLLSDILGAGESSRFYRELVEKQIALQAVMAPMALQDAGIIYMVGIPAQGKELKDVEAAMMAEIQKVIDNGVTDEEFQKARNIKEVSSVSGKKGTQEKAMSLAQYYSYYGDASLINKELENYMKVTKADIQRVAKKYLGTKNRVTLEYIPVKGE